MAATLDAFIAVNRFGLGARPGELERARSDPREWLRTQLKTAAIPPPIAALPSSQEIFAKFVEAQGERRESRREANEDAAQDSPPPQSQLAQGVRQVLAPMYRDQVAARYRVAATTERPLHERLVHFWTNHFAVSADKVVVLGLAATLENEAIRPNLSKRFVDMLLAVERHPAMILYLDNQQSAGPNSQLARLNARRPNQQRQVGINENLAREILELHTLGVNGGYTQADVTTFAKALTGWSVGGGRGRLAQGEPGNFVFRAAAHEPGAKSVLGKTYRQEGEAQARAVLEDLARHPATATFVATKLVRHFVGDEPPAAAVEKIAKVFLSSDGDLPSVHQAVIDLNEAWQPSVKFKTPHEYVISTFRMLDFVPREANQIAAPFDLLGQRPYTPGSPAGWPDTAAHWDGSDALMKRIEWATGLSNRLGSRANAMRLAETLPAISDHARAAIARAASASQALTLLLVSPEFMRR